MLLPILKYPDKKLRERCLPVLDFGSIFQRQIDDMFETMYAAPGVGLAAIQVGIFQRFLVMDVGIQEGEVIVRQPKVIVNPELISSEGEIEWEEGCLSCPELVVPTVRFKKVEVKALDRFGKPQHFFAEDLMSVCIQHEMDHMNGILIFDKLSRLKQDLYKQKLKKMAKEALETEAKKTVVR
ncbi:MAG: peptide deformylase [Deltaproteobacteria bacterium]|nr:peptide deformylase [Deltaproteobacteria bacterium]